MAEGVTFCDLVLSEKGLDENVKNVLLNMAVQLDNSDIRRGTKTHTATADGDDIVTFTPDKEPPPVTGIRAYVPMRSVKIDEWQDRYALTVELHFDKWHQVQEVVEMIKVGAEAYIARRTPEKRDPATGDTIAEGRLSSWVSMRVRRHDA